MRDAADIVASQMTEADHLEQVKAVAVTCALVEAAEMPVHEAE